MTAAPNLAASAADDQLTATQDLRPLFAPQSIAVVGASGDLGRPGGRCLSYIREVGFSGSVFGVNPNYEDIDGIPCVPGTAELPECVDMAIFLIPAAAVPAQIAAAEGRFRSAIICSSGFAESGAAGVEREEELREAIEVGGIPVLGPNCLGYFDARHSVAATFSTALQVEAADGAPGSIAFVSQSGALGAGIFGAGRQESAGLGLFVSTGNEASVGVAEVIRYLSTDPDLKTILCYVEGVRDGRAFVDAVRAARESGTRVLTVKVGRTDAGQRASKSHTGALAGSTALWSAALRRSGSIASNDMQALLGAGIAVDSFVEPVGPRIGIVSMSGGAAALMADRAEEVGLELPELDASVQSELSGVLPAYAGMANPVDYGAVYGDPDAIVETVRIVGRATEVDQVAVFVGLTPQYVGRLEPLIAEVAAELGKPVSVAWLGAPDSCLADLRGRGVVAYRDPSQAIDAVSALVEAGRPLTTNLHPDPTGDSEVRLRLEEARSDETADISEARMKGLLQVAGLPVTREAVVTSAEEAARFAAELGVPVAVKVDADGLIHKSDIGGVILGVAAEDVGAAFDAVVEAGRKAGFDPRGALISEMAPRGPELIVGARWDEQFGPSVLVGAGGVASEIIGDVSVELAPVTEEQASEMLASLQIAPILDGYRGEPAYDRRAVAKVIASVSEMVARSGGDLLELDLNPVVVYPKGEGCLILDAAGVLAEK